MKLGTLGVGDCFRRPLLVPPDSYWVVLEFIYKDGIRYAWCQGAKGEFVGIGDHDIVEPIDYRVFREKEEDYEHDRRIKSQIPT